MLEDVDATLRTELIDAGSEDEFWARLAKTGTPRIDEVDEDHVRVTLIHRQRGSAPERVYVDASSLTDHHAAQLTTMTRLDDTGIWFWHTEVSRTWRGNYRFAPVSKAVVDELDPPGIADTVEGVRSRFLGLLDHAVADEFNPRGFARSSLAEMPDAPVQRWWNDADLPRVDARELQWHSDILGNDRSVWIHETPGVSGQDRPLVIVLDGERWIEEYPLAPVLDRAGAEGLFPASVVVFVHTIDNDTRGTELPCNRRFWEAVIGELLPLVAESAAFTDDPRRTVVSGQSYGGLASMFAALTFPERFGLVSSHSGSFWWPTFSHGDTHGPEGGRIAEIIAAEGVPQSLTVEITVGIHEGHMPVHNAHIAQMLSARGIEVRYAEFDGGHEWVCWRGELVESLIRLLEQTHNAPDQADDDDKDNDPQDAEKNDR